MDNPYPLKIPRRLLPLDIYATMNVTNAASSSFPFLFHFYDLLAVSPKQIEIEPSRMEHRLDQDLRISKSNSTERFFIQISKSLLFRPLVAVLSLHASVLHISFCKRE